MYQVVFEYTKAAGGYEGVRTRTEYTSKEEFMEAVKQYDKEKQRVLAEGVTDEQGLDLTCRTPEVSRIKSAIEETFRDGEFIPEYLFNLKLPTSIFAIGFDREHLGRGEFTLYVRTSPSFAPTNDLKTLLMKAADASSDKESGQVDLELLLSHLQFALYYFASIRRIRRY